MQRRDVRYQAAIVREDHVLLLKVVDIGSGAMFWVLPGGGREPAASADRHTDTRAPSVGSTTALALLRHGLRWGQVGGGADSRDSNLAASGCSVQHSTGWSAVTSCGCYILKNPIGQDDACINRCSGMMMD
jgi:hypothetical protein